jgi:hypothetical protein
MRFLVGLLILLLASPSQALLINEIMPNPIDDCKDCTEWVELYSNQSWENLTLDAGGKTTSFDVNSTFLVITENKTKFLKYWYVNESLVIEGDLSLNNNGDYIILYQNNRFLENLTYPKIDENKTYSKILNGTWIICLIPTPGKANNCSSKSFQEPEKFAELFVYLDEIIFLEVTYDNLFKIEIENKENCSKKDDVNVNYFIQNQNETIKEINFTREIGCSGYANTGKWTPNQTGNFTICGRIINATTNFNNRTICKNVTVVDSKNIFCNLSISLFAPLIWYPDKKGNYYIFVNSSLKNVLLEIEYWIEDFFGNYIKKPYISSSIKPNKNTTRDFTPKLDCGDSVYLIKARIVNTYCKDSDLSDNSAEKLIAVIDERECEPEIIEKIIYKNSNSYQKETKESKKQDLEIEILELKRKLSRNQEFTTKVRIKNNLNSKISFEIYSYAYRGSSCITRSWTANREEISLNANEEKMLYLTNKIDGDVEDGIYDFKIRAKLDGKNIDRLDSISVEGDMEILSEVENKTELYNSEIELNNTNFTNFLENNFTEAMENNETEITKNISNENSTLITGRFYEKNLFDKLFRVIQMIVSYIVGLIEKSIKS